MTKLGKVRQNETKYAIFEMNTKLGQIAKTGKIRQIGKIGLMKTIRITKMYSKKKKAVN